MTEDWFVKASRVILLEDPAELLNGHVAITKLNAVHALTHPARLQRLHASTGDALSQTARLLAGLDG